MIGYVILLKESLGRDLEKTKQKILDQHTTKEQNNYAAS